MVGIRAEITKKLVRIGKREDPDQKQSDLHLCCLSRIFDGNECSKFESFKAYFTSIVRQPYTSLEDK